MTKQTDYLIIGSGIAGLSTALYLAELGPVTVVTKGQAKNANTYWAQGGIAAVMAKEDSFEGHIADTMEVGLNHNDPAAVRQLVFGAPKAIRFLESLGLKFSDEPLLEAGHSHPRVWRSSDFTGRDVLQVLLKAVQKHKSIELIENTDVVDLMLQNGACVGAFTRSITSDDAVLEKYAAKQTILATGGLGQLFSKTTNTLGSSGDGLALAVNAGLDLEDMEFIQFHPTALNIPQNGRYFLLSETLRGMGAKIVNGRGEAFLKRFDVRAELAPRDLVARAVHIEEMTSSVYLDARHFPPAEIKQKYPNLIQMLKSHQLDLTTDLIPITPAAHYACGGVPVDLKGATKLPGLFAVGEVARTGVHGANRLASNSLLESLVYAKIVADALEKSRSVDEKKVLNVDSLQPEPVNVEALDQVKAYGGRLGKIMWEHVGIMRTVESLEEAKKKIVSIPARDYRVQNRQLVCYKIIEACQARADSLGTHYMASEIL